MPCDKPCNWKKNVGIGLILLLAFFTCLVALKTYKFPSDRVGNIEIQKKLFKSNQTKSNTIFYNDYEAFLYAKLKEKITNQVDVKSIYDANKTQIDIVLKERNDLAYNEFSQRLDESKLLEINWWMVALIMLVSGIVGGLIRMFYGYVINIDFREQVKKILADYSIVLENKNIEEISNQIISDCNVFFKDPADPKIKDTIEAAIKKYLNDHPPKNPIDGKTDAEKELLNQYYYITLTEKMVSKIAEALEQPKDYSPLTYVVNIVYGVIGSLLVLIVLQIVGTDIMNFQSAKDYFIFTAWCFVGALFVTDVMKAALKKITT